MNYFIMAICVLASAATGRDVRFAFGIPEPLLIDGTKVCAMRNYCLWVDGDRACGDDVYPCGRAALKYVEDNHVPYKVWNVKLPKRSR